MDMCMDARWCISQLLHSLLSFFLCISLYRYCCFLLCVVNNNSNKQQTTTWVDNTKVMHGVRFVLCFLAFFWCLWNPTFSLVTAFFLGEGRGRGKRHVQGGLYWFDCLLSYVQVFLFNKREREGEERKRERERRERKKRETEGKRKGRVCVWKKERERSHEEELNLLGFHDATREVERERRETS